MERSAPGLDRSEALECQVQDGAPHLPPETLALVSAAKPGAGFDCSEMAEVLGHEALHSHRNPIDEDRPGEVPIVAAPVGPCGPPELQGLAVPPGRRGVGPRDGEGHGGGIMDSEVDELIEAIEVGVGREANLQTGRADPKIEQRPLGIRHESILPRPSETALPTSRVRPDPGGHILGHGSRVFERPKVAKVGSFDEHSLRESVGDGRSEGARASLV